MATGLQNYPNTSAADSDYPNKNIKDDTGADDGTPVNKIVYADMHQFLAKMLRLAVITANGNPDNEYNGLQYMQAAYKIFRTHGDLINFDRSISLVVSNAFSPIIILSPGAPNSGDIVMEDSTDDTAINGGTVTFVNDSSFAVDIFPDSSSDTINYLTSAYILPSLARVTMALDKPNGNWVVYNES